jgi:pimeloyl-ACP methyl ester carboxylesterase
VQGTITSGGVRLAAHTARPEGPAPAGGRPGLVMCHGFPSGPRGAVSAVATYPELADRIAAESGWTVMTFSFRGVGGSDGNFSLAGWLEDLRAAVDYLLATEDLSGVWLAGASTGGSLAICVGGDDERIRGVAALSARADFDDWAAEPRRFLDHAREIGIIKRADFPADPVAWGQELKEIRPLACASMLAPRPLLLVQGADDDVVPGVDARALADCHGDAELRIITGAGHQLRDDPRAIAVLLGWLERQAEGRTSD